MEGNKHLEAAKQAAWEAGKMLRENILNSRKIYYKGEVDLVTDSDNNSQNIIFSHLSSNFPLHDFLAEEGLSKQQGAEFRWIIDPLDGTTNFAHGFPVFCISIALERNGVLKLGLVYDPMREEMFIAQEGEGAFLNDKKIKVSKVVELNKSLVATGFPYDLRESEENNVIHFNNFLTRVQALRRCGSAAMDLCYVACGRFDGFWELKLNPWDVAAGSLIVSEAGGKVSDFRGNSLDIYDSEILASNGLIHQQMIQILQKGKGGEEHE